jgi:hypothetical protein
VTLKTLSPKPFISKNGVSYDLQYDTGTGNVQILQQNAPVGTKPIYQDGKWNASATELGFSQAEQNQYHQNTINSVFSAYQSVGGQGAGAKLPQWATKSVSTGQPGQTSINPQNAQSSNTTGNSGGGVEQLFGFLQNPAEPFQNFSVNGNKFGVGNEKELFGKDMMYPVDLMTAQQDNFAISQFRYRPSKADAIFGGKQAAIASLSGGLQTTSNLEQIVGTVFLPMPNSVSDNNNVSWGEDAMGNLAAAATANTLGSLGGSAGAAIAGAVLGGVTGMGMKEIAGKFLQGKQLLDLVSSGAVSQELAMLIGTEATSKLLKMQGFGVEAESILARGAGIVPNSNLELLFNSPTLRKFSFTYRLSPRSAEEAAMVRRIIRFFKQGMAVKKMSGKSGQASFFLGTPNVFKLEYRTGRSSIDGVNKFKTCALTSFSCNYTPDGLWAAYENGQPVSTIMQMSFDELEPIYDTDYQEGNIFGGRDDLSSVSKNSVGY